MLHKCMKISTLLPKRISTHCAATHYYNTHSLHYWLGWLGLGWSARSRVIARAALSRGIAMADIMDYLISVLQLLLQRSMQELELEKGGIHKLRCQYMVYRWYWKCQWYVNVSKSRNEIVEP